MPRRQISLAAFAVAAAGFFLPFVTLSCAGRPVVTATGIQLITRQVHSPSTSTPLGAPADLDMNGSLFVLVAFACSALGMVASRRGRRIVAACAGGIGAAALLLFASALSAQIRQRGNGMFTLQYEQGYYLALFGLIAAVTANTVVAERQNQVDGAPPSRPQSPG
jgi:hypothetical protein